MKIKKPTVEEINKMVLPGWQGKVDPTALRERIQALLDEENAYCRIQDQLAIVRRFLKGDLDEEDEDLYI
jgi:hypothetical protein